ncbi:hypothetical protein CPB84DRAFT_1842730 [Gymnopilus junonius]|uniref:Methyltransferase domain-containing protein n=1 Tax=Gymnopilus junonius TaxID=109634 RepID=A0A9P5TTP5_GYMJU|nr:hypothetical protein CPB84DRAFT_1842730 [Gymnopilus junonius]
MAATSARPVSQVLPDIEDEQPTYRKRVRSHYRPFSTLYTAPPYLDFAQPEEEKPSSRFLKRASSISGFQALQTMTFGINFKQRKNSPLTPEAAEIGTSNPKSPKTKPKAYVTTKRPSTANGSLQSLPRLKTKRSMNVIMSSSDATASSVSLGTVTPPSRPVLALPPRPEDPPRPSTGNGKAVKFKERQRNQGPLTQRSIFTPMGRWQERHNMKFHPYGKDAVYMQAYDPVLLESDRFSDQLFQRLSHGLPSFYDYGKNPPATVLDLGCGEGHWVLHAASVWKDSVITGLDMVDVTLPALETTDNANFVQGNFVKYPLPFEDKSFELVRMANLTLAIPYLQWVALLTEVRRVLTVNGRLEIIDDQICFLTLRKRLSQRILRFDTLQGEESGSGESATLYDVSRPSSFEGRPTEEPPLSASETARRVQTQLFRGPRYYARPPRPVITDPHFIQPSDEIWESKRKICQDIETLFQSMLKDPEEHHEVALKPDTFVTSFLGYVFGNNNAREKDHFSINLAEWNSPLALSDENEDDVETKEPTFAHLLKKAKGVVDALGLTEAERAELTLESPIPPIIQPKAAKQLGLPDYAYTPSSNPFTASPARSDSAEDGASEHEGAGIFGVSFSTLTAATAQVTVAQRRGIKPLGMVQSPGLLIRSKEGGSEYMRMDPLELEMHACKWIHTLLGCRQALGQYVTKFLDEKGGRLVDDEMFGHYMSEYEGFSRQRFGWPSGVGEKDETELLIDVLQQSPIQPWNTSQSQSDKSLHVRSIRVYHAVRADDGPLQETPLLQFSASYI